MFPETCPKLRSRFADTHGKLILNAGSNTWQHYHNDQTWIWEHVLEPLLANGNKIINADISPEVFDLPEGLTHQIVDVTKPLPYEYDTFDIVLCTSMIEHVLDPVAMLQEFHRVLRPAGVLILEAPAEYPIHYDPIDTGLRLKSREELEELLGVGWLMVTCEVYPAKSPFEGLCLLAEVAVV